jgi:hypothetical protein
MPPSDPLPENATNFVLGMLLHDAITRRDMRSARALLHHLNRAPKRVPIALPDGLRSGKDIATAANALLQGVVSGVIGPGQAKQAAGVLELARRAVETEDLERRIEELEARAKRK